MSSMLHVGADLAKIKAALPDITKAIVTIINQPAGDDVKKAAIAALASSFSVQNVSVEGCTFTGDVK